MLHHKTREKIARIALEYIHTPYFEGASIKKIGCDCAGLIIGVAKEVFGIEIDRAIGIENALSLYFEPIETPKTGDIIVFTKPEIMGEFHSGFLIENKILHSRQNQGVILNSYSHHFQKLVHKFYSFKV